MRLWLLALVPWMAMAAAQAQTPKAASVAFTYQGAFGQEVWRVGDDCWAPASLLQRWGWTVRVSGQEADIDADGRKLRVTAGRVNGLASLNLSQALDQLGASADWMSDGITLKVLGVVRILTFEGTKLRVDATLGTSASTFTLERPGRLVIDLKGARIPPAGLSGLPAGIRAGQYDPDTVRLVVERTGAELLKPAVPQPGRSLEFDLAPLRFDGRPADPAPAAPSGPKIPAAAASTEVGPAQAVRESPSETTLVLPLSRPLIGVPTAAYLDSKTITLRFANAAAASVQDAKAPDAPVSEPESGVASAALVPEIESEFIEGVDFMPEPAGVLQVVVRLKRPMAFLLSTQKAAVELKLVAAKGADGRLAGKTIVVDAGHGGTDSGAVAPDRSAFEKTLNLKVARELARMLAAEGANVIMTRNDDVRVPLTERPAIANRARADAFVSVHFNSNRVANSRSGTMTFFHRQDPQGILLAQCVNEAIRRASGLPDLGAISDTRIYSSGFAVLRDARMPAVLLELGFINHRTDRARMVSAAYQRDMAAAVVKGLKVFFGDEQATDEQP